MSSDTSNLFSKAEVREIKRFTKGNITFKHYTFYNDDISTLFTTTQNGGSRADSHYQCRSPTQQLNKSFYNPSYKKIK